MSEARISTHSDTRAGNARRWPRRAVSLLYCTRRHPALEATAASRFVTRSKLSTRNVAGPPYPPGAPRTAAPRTVLGAPQQPGACGGGVGRLGRGRARATGGLEQRLAGPRLGGAPAPVGPKLRPSRSAHRPASARQAAAQRGVVEEGAVLRVVVGHESAPMARRARSVHRVRSRSPSWVPRRARDDSGRRTSEALTGGSAQPSLPQMSLPGGRPYPRGRGGPARRLGGGHGDPNTTPRAARVLEARARVEAQRNRGSLA